MLQHPSNKSSLNPLPPSEVRFTAVHVEPWPDGKRVRIHVSITPFAQRPNLEARILDIDNELLSQADIIETMNARLVFTMHLRADEPHGPFRLQITLAYTDLGLVDQREVNFSLDDIQA